MKVFKCKDKVILAFETTKRKESFFFFPSRGGLSVSTRAKLFIKRRLKFIII